MSFYNRFKHQVWFTSMLVLTLGMTSCNRANEKANEVSIDGAAVGFPISLAVAEEYEKTSPKASVSVASSGTGGGILISLVLRVLFEMKKLKPVPRKILVL
jgi:phosphate transport system substrate-binding protein